jgi:hypothetical protein
LKPLLTALVPSCQLLVKAAFATMSRNARWIFGRVAVRTVVGGIANAISSLLGKSGTP